LPVTKKCGEGMITPLITDRIVVQRAYRASA
jgi:hypothetical protein